MQLLCYHLFQNQLSRRVEVEVWEKALQATLDDLSLARFDYWFSRASAAETKILHIIAKAAQPPSIKDIRNLMAENGEKTTLKSIAECVEGLVEKGFLEKTAKELHVIPDHLFSAYVQTL